MPRFLVMGAGAVGGVIAGRLFQAGYDVTAVARGAHYEAMREGGLRLESPEGSVTVPVPVVDDPAAHDWSEQDVVLLAVKSQDTAAALTALAAVAPPSVLLVCAQNGVSNEPAALRWFGNVAGICVMCPTSHLEPGVVQAHSSPTTGILDVGLYPSGVSEPVVEVAAALSRSTFESTARPDIMSWKHTKLLANLGNAVQAVCGTSAALSELVRREGEAVLAAAAIPFVPVEEDQARRGSLVTVKPIGGRLRQGSSSWQSLERRTGAIECDYLNGEVVRIGRLHGVPTPANAVLQRLANQLARERRAPGSMSEAAVLGEVDAWRNGSAGRLRD